MAGSEDQEGIIDGPVVQGGGTTEDGRPIGTELSGAAASGKQQVKVVFSVGP